MFSSLKLRNYRIYWFGSFVSLIGTWIQNVALSWLVFELTKSAFLLGFVGFLSSIPVFFLSLFGGVLADRKNKRNILIATQIIFMLLALLLAALTQLNLITPLQIMLIALLGGVVMAFDAPSRQAMVIELVGRTNLPNAIALNSVAFNSSRIIGPALAAIFISVIGMSGCFYANGVSFLPFIIGLFFIKVNNKPLTATNTAFTDLKEGLVFVKNNTSILALVTIVAVVSLFGVSYVILMPIFANDVLNVGVKGLGVLMSSSGIGALFGALILARLGDFKFKGKFLIASAFIFSFSLILFSLSKLYLLSIIALIFIGGTSVTSVALINTVLQTNVPDKFRGRVMSIFMLTFAGIMPFGNLIAGSLAGAFGVSMAVLLSGIACLVFFLVISIGYPAIRQL